jgi:hypothetical protein
MVNVILIVIFAVSGFVGSAAGVPAAVALVFE